MGGDHFPNDTILFRIKVQRPKRAGASEGSWSQKDQLYWTYDNIFKSIFLWLRRGFELFSIPSMPPIEAFLNRPMILYYLLATMPRQPLSYLLLILRHPTLCHQCYWPHITHRNLFSHCLPSLPTDKVPFLQFACKNKTRSLHHKYYSYSLEHKRTAHRGWSHLLR